MTIDELVREVRAHMQAHAEPGFAGSLRRFFKEQPVDPWGVRGKYIHELVPRIYRELKDRPADERDRFAEELWKSGRLEEGALIPHLYRRFRKQFGAREFRVFERWIDRCVHNWAHCDGVASWLLAGCIANQPELIAKLPPWTRSKNRWKRRASAVALLQEAKQGRHTGEILNIADLLRNDFDEMVQKGVGWLLKETYPKRPHDIMRFLSRWTGARLVVRYAAEKMTSADRRKLGFLK